LVKFLEDAAGILYLASMRSRYFLICILLLTGCTPRSITNPIAIDSIVEVSAGPLEKEDVEVWKLTRVGGSEAIAETRLKTAFRLENVNGEWIVREVRIGHGQWEKVTNLEAALQAVKIEETQEMLNRLASAVRKYREITGNLPAFKDFVDLSDQLSPKYLTPLLRLDSWRQPLAADRSNAGSILLRSAGPDRKLGTPDDLTRTIER
jgi:hypothetical protein